jgi:hypothetical protein
MIKYRIVSREDAHGPKYFAQHKVLWFFWVDDYPISHPSVTNNFLDASETPSRNLKLVENYVETVIRTEEFFTHPPNIEKLHNGTIVLQKVETQKVIKTY